MGSSGNQSPWAPYDTYKDCSQGICSIYCPQWCYIIFPPPPPSSSFTEDDSSADFSPLIIAVIGILASAFILVSYFTLISKYCRRRGHDSSVVEFSENRDRGQGNGEAWPAGTSDGLDETLIKSITVCRYKKNDGFVESTDCSVCLSEFQENENLRLLPKCSHAFHIPCIDTWLKSHSNCPLCRANITPAHIFPTNQTQAVQETAGNMQMAAFEYQNRNDAVVVIDDLEVGVCEDCVVNLADVPKTESEGSRKDAVHTMRRSVSLNSAQVSIADILRVTGDDGDDDDDGLQVAERLEKHRDSVSNLVAMKRSFSTGRFMLTRSEKGWSSTILS